MDDIKQVGDLFLATTYAERRDGYKAGSADFFDKESFVEGYESNYINPRTNHQNRNLNPISGKFHWTDIAIYSPWRIKLALYYVISH